MKLTNKQILAARGAIESVTYTGEKDDLGRPMKRELPRKLSYALYKTGKALDREWEDVADRLKEGKSKFTTVQKVTTESKDDKGEPIVEEVERFKTVKSKKEYFAWEAGELNETSEVAVHKLTDEAIIKALEGDDDEMLPDAIFPDIYELEFIWKDDE